MSIPAFPRPFSKDDTDTFDTSPTYNAHVGMTLRDYFAAKSMQGLMHNNHPCDFLENKNYLEDIAMASYFMANAMMKAREA